MKTVPLVCFQGRGNSVKLRSSLAVAVGAALTSAPIVAQAAGAPVARTGSSVEDEVEGVGGGFLLPLLAVLAVIVAVVVIADDDESPASP